MDSLSRRILSDPINKWVFSNTKKNAYLVGGYLRDLLLRDTSKDKDFVIEKDFEGTARRAAKRFQGTFIILKKNQTCRIALKNGEFIDFTSLKCPIEEDLAQRDFTINAMAWSQERGIIDPFGGRDALKKKVIKAVLPSNFADDPLRVLRAYRIASEKGFIIERDTKKYLRRYANGLSIVASERITEELFRILNHKYAGKQLKDAYDNAVLEKIIIQEKRRLRDNLKLMTKYRIFIDKIDKKSIHRFFKEKVGQGLTRDGLIKLSILLIDKEYEASRFKSLRPSKAIKKGIIDIHKALRLSRNRITDKKLYEIFKIADEYVLETALLLSVIKMSGSSRFLKRADDFIRIRKNILLSGNDIQTMLKVSQGVIIGKILDSLQKQRFLMRLKTRAGARAWITSNFT
jgi:tRNA nucleotidyltransferase/poly(A) polymerase